MNWSGVQLCSDATTTFGSGDGADYIIIITTTIIVIENLINLIPFVSNKHNC